MEGINATAAAGLRSLLVTTGDGLMDLITVLLGMMHGVVSRHLMYNNLIVENRVISERQRDFGKHKEKYSGLSRNWYYIVQ